MHILVPGTLAFSTMSQTWLNSTSVWLVLAFVDLLMSSTYQLLGHWQGLGSLQTDCETIEAFLHSEETRDSRINHPTTLCTRYAPLDAFPVQFLDAHIAPVGTDYAKVLVNAAIESSTLTMVVGPAGSGKTTLLHAILGEADIIHGSVYVEPQHIAYCDQASWIRNVSVRENIIGENPYDEVWFNTVVVACMLRELDELLLAGAGGSSLSKGQKQQIVRSSKLTKIAPLANLSRSWPGPSTRRQSL